MHTVGLVVGDKPEQQLEKFSMNLKVEPYVQYLDEEDIEDMAEEYGIDPRNLAALCEKVEDWFDCEGLIDNHRLAYICDDNPDAKFDFYEIGGRWKGYLKLTTGEFSDQARLCDIDIKSLAKDAPGFLLYEGVWREDDIDLSEKLDGAQTSKWELEFKKFLNELPDKLLVTVVDIHS